MNVRKHLKRFLPLLLLGFAAQQGARAATLPFSGTFAADNSTFSVSFATATTQNYTFQTTSYATGGFVPVLTLFNAMTGVVVDFNGSAISDAILMDTLAAGSYVLYLTEFPNVAIGKLSDGFLFAGSPNITGMDCGVTGGKFLDDITCQQRTANYAFTVTNTNPVPEPSTLLLVLPPALLLFGVSRRFTA